jgi:hypothetical protein
MNNKVFGVGNKLKSDLTIRSELEISSMCPALEGNQLNFKPFILQLADGGKKIEINI